MARALGQDPIVRVRPGKTNSKAEVESRSAVRSGRPERATGKSWRKALSSGPCEGLYFPQLLNIVLSVLTVCVPAEDPYCSFARASSFAPV